MLFLLQATKYDLQAVLSWVTHKTCQTLAILHKSYYVTGQGVLGPQAMATTGSQGRFMDPSRDSQCADTVAQAVSGHTNPLLRR